MDRYYKWKVLLIIAAVAASLWRAYPVDENVNLGLDLQGGMQLLLQVELEKIPEEGREDATDRAVEVIRNRIDEFGVREPVIAKQGNEQIVVQLPGITDRDRAKEIVGKTAHLEFKLVSDEANIIEKASDGEIDPNYEIKEMKSDLGTETLVLEKEPKLTGEHLTSASLGFDQYGASIVQLEFDGEGAKTFDSVTFQNIGRQLAIVLDGKVHSAPVIRDRIPNGQAQISGGFTAQEASDLALVLRAGSLPAPVSVIEERTVGPERGADSIRKGLKAGLLGVVLIVLFMPVYYLIAGVVADLALIMYGILVLGAFAGFGATLTLPGIAGLILSVGMAVDANVLIFERMREEKEMGKTTRASVSAGYNRAFSAILDSNITTLLTSLILFMFGTGPIKGFAVTLSIGIVASMFSALVITRVFFDFLTKKNPNLNLNMMKLIGTTHIPFLRGRVFAYGFSVVTIAIGLFAIVQGSKLNFGVEFTGGTLVQVKFQDKADIENLRAQMVEANIPGLVVQRFGQPEDNEYVIKTSEKDTAKVEAAARQIGDFQIQQVDQIGPSVSLKLREKALQALAFACLGILVYIAWRFKWKYGLAVVIAMLHDTIFTFGVFALSGREISLPIIAALLTVMGYSVNDTIVNFDRVRDNLKAMRRKPFSEIVETSINQTLARTILTSATTILAAGALFVFGGSAVQDFAFTLLIGFAIGTYSTIFVASSLAVDMKAQK